MSATYSPADLARLYNVSSATARGWFDDRPGGRFARIPNTGRRVLTAAAPVNRELGLPVPVVDLIDEGSFA